MIGADPPSTIVGRLVHGTLINDPSGTHRSPRRRRLCNDGFIAETITLNGGHLSIVVNARFYNATTVYSEATTGGAPVQTCGTAASVSQASSQRYVLVAILHGERQLRLYWQRRTTFGAVNVTLTRLAMTAVPGMTKNQRAVGNVLEPGYSTGLTGDLATFYANLFAATSLAVLDQLSGAGTAAAQDGAFAAGGQFSGMMMQQVHELAERHARRHDVHLRRAARLCQRAERQVRQQAGPRRLRGDAGARSNRTRPVARLDARLRRRARRSTARPAPPTRRRRPSAAASASTGN